MKKNRAGTGTVMDRAIAYSSLSYTLPNFKKHNLLDSDECYSLELCKAVALGMWAEILCSVIREIFPIMEDHVSKDMKAVRE